MHKEIPKFFIFIDKYNSEVFKNINKNIGVIYRNYTDSKREKELKNIANICKKRRFKLFVSNDIKLVHKYKADGVYIPAFNKTKHFSNLEKKKLVIIGSAHNQKEIKKKISQKCEVIFLAPIFPVEKKKNHLGLHTFNYLSHINKVSIYALGGINKNNINKLNLLSANGFGGIRMFKKKPASERPVFIKKKFF